MIPEYNIKFEFSVLRCFEACVLTILDNFKLDWRITLLHTFQMYFDQERNRRQAMILKSNDIILENVDRYYNISFSKKVVNTDSYVWRILTKNQILPVIIELDGYCCKWLDYYNRIHASHQIICIALDDGAAGIYCADPVGSKQVEFLDKNTLNNSVTSIYFPVGGQSKSPDFKDAYKRMKNLLRQDDIYNQYTSLIDVLNKSRILSSADSSQSFWELNDAIKWAHFVVGMRFLFSQFLSGCYEHASGIRLDSINQLRGITGAWKHLNNIVLRRNLRYSSGVTEMEDILKEKVISIIENEKDFITSLLK